MTDVKDPEIATLFQRLCLQPVKRDTEVRWRLKWKYLLQIWMRMGERKRERERGTKAQKPKIYFFNPMVLNQRKFSIPTYLNLSLPCTPSRGYLVMSGGDLLLASVTSESRTLLNILPKTHTTGHPTTKKEFSFPKDSEPVLKNSALMGKVYSYEKV